MAAHTLRAVMLALRTCGCPMRLRTCCTLGCSCAHSAVPRKSACASACASAWARACACACA
eukprot:6320192-Alexandrium_andersonii.AAC.1